MLSLRASSDYLVPTHVSIVILALVWVSSPLSTEDVLAANDPPQPRLEYDKHNAPTGIRFMMFLRTFANDYPDIDDVIEWDLRSMGFRVGDVPTLRAYFLDLYHQIEEEIDASHQQMACNDDASRLRGEELGALFNAFEDVRFGTYSKYVGIASAELAKLGYSSFPEQLESMTHIIGVHSFENRAIAVQRGQEMQDLRAKLCKAWAQLPTLQ